jgi:hypothetical protein
MATTKFGRSGFTIPVPKPGDGTKIFMNHDGSMTCSWDNRMALDQELDPQDDGGNPGTDLVDKIRELLAGKLEDADIEALTQLITGGEQAPAKLPPGIASDAAMRRYVAQASARASTAQRAALVKRFPNLANARVV